MKRIVLAQQEEIRRLRPEPTQYLRTGDLKRMLKCSDSTLRRYRIDGRLHPKKVRGVWYYDLAEVRGLVGEKHP